MHIIRNIGFKPVGKAGAIHVEFAVGGMKHIGVAKFDGERIGDNKFGTVGSSVG